MIIRQTLVVLTALLSASACALAQTFSVGNLTYSVTDKTAGEVDVSSCESYESEIDVPATVSHGGISYKVTGIGITAFSVKSNLRRIGLPEGIRHIGEEAFAYCSQLTSMSLPASVESIGSKAFSGCVSLSSIVLPDSLISIGDGAFEKCRSISSITMPSGTTSIGCEAFKYCMNLGNVVIGEGVTSIGDRAFRVCTSLHQITRVWGQSARRCSTAFNPSTPGRAITAFVSGSQRAASKKLS